MMMDEHRWSDDAFSAQKDRLRALDLWFPYPCLISFALIALFTGHILLGLNPRLGHPAQVLPFGATPAEEGSIWLSVSLQAQEITVTTSDRRVFRWPAAVTSLGPLMPFVSHVRRQTDKLALATSLAGQVTRSQSMVVLAVDQTLTYGHVKPLIYALASAGISEYAFETRQPFGSE